MFTFCVFCVHLHKLGTTSREHASKEVSSGRRTETSPKRKVNCFRHVSCHGPHEDGMANSPLASPSFELAASVSCTVPSATCLTQTVNGWIIFFCLPYPTLRSPAPALESSPFALTAPACLLLLPYFKFCVLLKASPKFPLPWHCTHPILIDQRFFTRVVSPDDSAVAPSASSSLPLPEKRKGSAGCIGGK